MGFGDGSGPKPKSLAPTPTKMAPEVELSKRELLEQERRRKGRAASQVTTPGMLQPAEVYRPTLKTKLGA